MNFKDILPKEITNNPFEMIGKQWLLVSAGDKEKCNTMTASWGGVGVIWNKNVVTVYIRPQRYTYEFLEKCDYFSISVLPEAMRQVLAYCGKVSGRDEDKIKTCHLTPRFEDNICGFEEAELNIYCRKLYAAPITEAGFVDQNVCAQNYPQKDFHIMYIGEIIKVEKKDKD